VYEGTLLFIEEAIERHVEWHQPADVQIMIDRGAVQHGDEDNQFRISDSVQTAFFEGDGVCTVHVIDKELRTFSDKFELDGITFEEPSINLFSFNNPYGACRRCEGFGKVLGIDEDLVIPDKTLSVYEGAIAPWRSDKMKEEFMKPLLKNGIRFDFPSTGPTRTSPTRSGNCSGTATNSSGASTSFLTTSNHRRTKSSTG
jgi:excinuclease ABC subunit A